MIMNDKRFKVISGKNDNRNLYDNRDLYEEIVWVRPDTGEKVIPLHPPALKAKMSERRLCTIAKNAEEHPEIEVTYSRFDEEELRRKKAVEELEEMFKDNDKVIVFNPTDKHR